MISYSYQCEHCHHSFEEERSILQGPRQGCPKCRHRKPDFHQVFGAPIVIIKNGPTTFGQQSEANTKRIGHYGMDDMREQDKLSREQARESLQEKLPRGASLPDREGGTPWWRDEGSKPLDISGFKSKQDVSKFIETGEKPK